jgi:hypothetical protein
VLVGANASLEVYSISNYQQIFSELVNGKITAMQIGKTIINDNYKEESISALFVGYSDNPGIDVFNLKNLKRETTILSEHKQPSKILSDETGGYFYILYPKEGCIDVLDLKKLKIIDSFLTDTNPVDMVYLPPGTLKKMNPPQKDGMKSTTGKSTGGNPLMSRRGEKEEVLGEINPQNPVLIVTSASNRRISFIDAISGQLIGDIKIKGKPGKILPAKNGKIFYTIDTENFKLLTVEPESLQITKEIQLTDVTKITDSAMDSDNLIWLTSTSGRNEYRLIIIDPSTGKINSISAIGKEPEEIESDAVNKRMWVLNARTKTIGIFDTNTKTNVFTVKVDKRPTSICIDNSIFNK